MVVVQCISCDFQGHMDSGMNSYCALWCDTTLPILYYSSEFWCAAVETSKQSYSCSSSKTKEKNDNFRRVVSALIKIRTWNYSRKRRTVETIIEAAPHLEDYWPWVVWIIDFMTIVVVTTLQQQQLCCPRKWPEWWMSHFMPLSTAPNSKWTAEPGISIKILHATISRKFQLK